MLQVTVSDMACSACADTITKAVQALDTQATVNADLNTKHIKIESSVPDEQIKAAIADAGYSVQ
ncbi:MAG: heavy-metal-associated domain-containing protein [Elainellaceae cyanobacterium]